MSGDGRTGGFPPFQIPLTILAVALFLMVGFQTIQLIRERDNLAEARGTQQPAVQQALKMRQQLEALAGKTAQLAAEGDAGARAIVEDLRRQGITVKPPGAN
jgi:hypothetical protein